MRLPKLSSMRTSALAVVAAAAFAIALFATPRDALANISDPTGVLCGNFENAGINVYGISLARIERAVGGGPNDIAFTGVAYVNNQDNLPSCTDDDQAPLPVPFTDQAGNRPNIIGEFIPGGGSSGDGQIVASECVENLSFGPAPPGWNILSLEVDLDKSGTASGSFSFQPADAGLTPPSTCEPTAPPIVLTLTDALYVDGPDDSVANFTHDWDKDGCTDWNELAPFAGKDPFNPDDCKPAGAVGGVAELPDERMTPLQTGDSSGRATGLFIALSAGVAAAVSTAGTAWALRRRFVR